MIGTDVQFYKVPLDTIDIKLIQRALRAYIDQGIEDQQRDYAWEITEQLEGVLKNEN